MVNLLPSIWVQIDLLAFYSSCVDGGTKAPPDHNISLLSIGGDASQRVRRRNTSVSII